MNNLIKNLLREGLLSEALMDLSIDVDNLYSIYFKSDCEEIINNRFITDEMFERHVLSTSSLTSPLAIEANAINPCIIRINYNGGNYYNPIDKIISLSSNFAAINFIKKNKNSLDASIKFLIKNNNEEYKRLTKEFDASRLKGSIHHELTHWVDDTLHNKHIEKDVKKSIRRQSTTDSKGRSRYVQPMEIQALIHNVVQLKRENESIWDNLTFNDMLSLSPVLSSLFNSFSDDDKFKWKRLMRNRMARENLLGKEMSKM